MDHQTSALQYLTGFANECATEALPGALPAGRNSPQRVAYGLYAEQISGTAFTAPRHSNRRSWLYRIRPTAVHPPFEPFANTRWLSRFDEVPTPPNQLRWSPQPYPDAPTDFIDGIVVDETGATSDPTIFAAGDVACMPLSWRQGRLRLESWANAQNQAIAVGRTMAGDPVSYDDLPWFWSDQYDLNIQMVGLFSPGREQVVRGDPSAHSFSLFQLEGGRIVAAASVNAPRDLKHAKQLIKKAKPVDAVSLADVAIPLDRLPAVAA